MRQGEGTGAALHMGTGGARLTIAGILLSGPLGLLLVSLARPSGSWQGAEVFAREFHWIQTVHFFGGFALVFGCVMLFAAVYQLAEPDRKPAALVALVSTAVFTALIFFNYVCQTTFLPALATAYRLENDPVISTFSLANPLSPPGPSRCGDTPSWASPRGSRLRSSIGIDSSVRRARS